MTAKPGSQWYSFSVNGRLRLGDRLAPHVQLSGELTANYYYQKDDIETNLRVGLDPSSKIPKDLNVRQQLTGNYYKASVTLNMFRDDHTDIRNIDDPEDPNNGKKLELLSPSIYALIGNRVRSELAIGKDKAGKIGGDKTGIRSFTTQVVELGVMPTLISVSNNHNEQWIPGFGEDGRSWTFKENSYLELQLYFARQALSAGKGVNNSTWSTGFGIDPALYFTSTGYFPDVLDRVNPAYYPHAYFDKQKNYLDKEKETQESRDQRIAIDMANFHFYRFLLSTNAINNQHKLEQVTKNLSLDSKKIRSLYLMAPLEIFQENTEKYDQQSGHSLLDYNGKTYSMIPVEYGLKITNRSEKNLDNPSFREWALSELAQLNFIQKEAETDTGLYHLFKSNIGRNGYNEAYSIEDGVFETHKEIALYLAIRTIASRHINSFDHQQDSIYIHSKAGKKLIQEVIFVYKHLKKLISQFYADDINVIQQARIPYINKANYALDRFTDKTLHRRLQKEVFTMARHDAITDFQQWAIKHRIYITNQGELGKRLRNDLVSVGALNTVLMALEGKKLNYYHSLLNLLYQEKPHNHKIALWLGEWEKNSSG